MKYSKKRKKNKEKKKKESEIPENLFHDSPVPKKVPRQVIENIKPHHINLTHLPSPLPLTQCIQKYTADFTIEKYSFFDQVCSFYEKKKKKMRLIGKKHSFMININYFFSASHLNINFNSSIINI